MKSLDASIRTYGRLAGPKNTRMTNRFLILLASAPLIMGDAPPPWLHTWLVEQTVARPQTLEVDLVRARIRQVSTGSDLLTIKITVPRGQRMDGVQIHVERSDRGITIHDSYPSHSSIGVPEECVPGNDPRGAFWRSDVVFDVQIAAPPGVTTRVHVMDARQ